MDLNAILRIAVELGASDIHMKLDQPPMLRTDGSIAPLPECPPLGEQDLLGALEAVTLIAPKRMRQYQTTGDLDIAYTAEGLPRFRVGNGSNVGHQSQTETGNSILLNSARFQGALYATYGIDIATTSNADGPLDGAPVKVGQSVNSTWPVFTVVPAGIPGNPVAYAEPQPPVYEG